MNSYQVTGQPSPLRMPTGTATIREAQPATPQVTVQLSMLTAMIEQLDKATENLITKIAPVLKPDGPTATGTAKLEDLLVPVAESIRVETMRLGTIIARIHSVAGRVEV